MLKWEISCMSRLGPRVRLTALVAVFGALVPTGCVRHEGGTARPGHPGAAPSPPAAPVLRLAGAWARTGTAGNNTAVYLTIHNDTAQADVLSGATCDAAETVEVHRSFADGAMMRMAPAGDVEVPANDTVKLEPGGLHVMLIGLRRDLTEGAWLPVTLRFTAAGEVPLVAEVRAAPPPATAPQMSLPRDLLLVIPRGTAALQMRGEGGVAIPPQIELTAGAAIAVRNEDEAMHYFFSLPVAPGQTIRREFPTAGKYGYTSILSCSLAGSESVMVTVHPRM